MLTFNNAYSIADVLNALLLVVAIVGILFTYRQIKDGNKTQRATFFKELYSTMYSDPVIKKGYYLIEYDGFVYDDSFHGSDDEQSIDRLLTFVDLICDLYFQGVLSKHEMRFFEYELTKIYKNRYILKYLQVAAEARRSWGIEARPAFSFIRYCEQLSTTQHTKLEDVLIITPQELRQYAEDTRDRSKRQ